HLVAQRPEEVLEEVGVRFLEAVTSPWGLSLHRLVVAEAQRIPEIAQQFWQFGPARSRAWLTEYFDRQIARGLLWMPDSSAAADYFLNMLSGTVRLQCLLGLREPPTQSEIRQVVHDAVGQFLHGCLAR